jgi:hypothetical protein
MELKTHSFGFFKKTLKIINQYLGKMLRVDLAFLRDGGGWVAGLPDFPWYKIPKWGKIIYHMTTKYTKWP